MCGSIGLVIAFLTLFITEPKRGQYNSEANNKEAKELEIDGSRFEKLKRNLKIILTNKTCVFICLATAFRFFGSFAISFWSARFFKKVFPEYQNEFSIINGVSVIVINLPSIYIGGALGDHYEKSYPQVKAFIAGVCPVLAFPFLLVAFVFSQNFWFSVWIYMFNFFFSEMWMGNTISMMQNLFPSQIVGTALSIFFLSGGLAGAAANLILGILNDHYVTHEGVDDSHVSGYLITIIAGISYFG